MIRSAPTLVLLYHRVADVERDTHGLAVSPRRFEEHLAHLRRHERVVPVDHARRRSSRRRIAVTFDDGYADNALTAAPMLVGAGLPATFYVTVDLIDRNEERWWDELERLVIAGAPAARHLRVHVDGAPLVADVGSPAARARAHWAIYHRLRPRRADVIADVLDQVRAQVDAPPSGGANRFMTTDELRTMASRPELSIGGHATTHQVLSALPPDEQRAEIVEGRRRLQAVTGASVATFAYPFGAPETFDGTTVALVEEAGYELACAGWPGVVTPRTDRWRLPRLVVKDWDVDELAARIDGWCS